MMKNVEEATKALQQQLASRDKKIVQLNYLLSEREREAAELAEVVAQMQGSLSWRLGAPVRVLGRQWLRLKSVYRTLKRTLGFGGGLLPTVKKVIQIFSQEGVAGIKMRIRHIRQHHQPLTPAHYGKNVAKPLLDPAHYRKNTDYLTQMRHIDISQYDIISLDVFDTALIRQFASPDDIFGYVEAQHQLPAFKAKRLQAESQARAQHKTRKDIDTDLIYAQPALADIDSELEMAAELQFCVANPIIYDLYMRAKIQKKKIYFVSDMYLKKAQIEQLLHKQGYTDYEQLYVSSEDDLIKGDGSRFAALKDEFAGKKVLHLGDNYLADFEWPIKQGFDAIHYQEPAAFYQDDVVLGSLYEGIKGIHSTGLSFVLGSYRRWKYGDKSTGWSLWRDIGFIFGGPLLYLFSQYIDAQARAQQADQLCFLARDGLIIKKVYDLLYQTPEQESIYLLASRRAMTFPLFTLDKEACKHNKLLDIYVSTHAESTAAEVFERLAYPEDQELLSQLEALEKNGLIDSDKALKELLQRNHAQLQEKAEDELQGLLAYLEQKQVLDPTKNSLLVDVGWVGTIQDSLNALMAATQQPKEFGGLYMGVLPVATNVTQKHGFLFDKENQDNYLKLSEFRNFIELLTSAPTPGLVRFSATEPSARFDEQPSAQESERIAIAKELQHGIMDFAHTVKQVGLDKVPAIDADDLVFLFELLQQQPSAEVRSMLSQTKHARLPSNAFTHSVIEF